jgi:hypothetical protein
MVIPFDRGKSLQQLENADWGEPTYDSHLVRTVHRLRRKPLNEFTVEDLRIVILQEIGLPFLIPLAVEQLERNPLVDGDYYEGDLLNAVLHIGEPFWTNHPDLFRRTCDVVMRVKNMIPTLDDLDRTKFQRLLNESSPAFKHPLLPRQKPLRR